MSNFSWEIISVPPSNIKEPDCKIGFWDIFAWSEIIGGIEANSGEEENASKEVVASWRGMVDATIVWRFSGEESCPYVLILSTS